MAIQDDFTIDYNAQTITYTGGYDNDGAPSSIYRMNELYTWLQDTFDEPAQMDDPVPMSAQTPVDYTLLFPWFLAVGSEKALYEGSLQTSGWARSVGSAIGIVAVQLADSTAPIASDIGKPIVHETDADSGVLVGWDPERYVIFIRPDSSAAANSFDSTGGNLDVTGGTQNLVQMQPAWSGESIWACVYTLGGIQNYSSIQVYQALDLPEAPVTYLDETTMGEIYPWWFYDVDYSAASGVQSGHVDLLIQVQAEGYLIDEGRLQFSIRQHTKTHAHYVSTIASAQRVPIPLATLTDLNNTDGYESITSNAATGSWSQADVGQLFRIDETGTTRKQLVITALSGTNPNFTIEYYKVGKDWDISAADVIEDIAETKTMTVDTGGKSDVNAALLTAVDLTSGGALGDIDEDGTNEYYSFTLDCDNKPLADVYERFKFLLEAFYGFDLDQTGGSTIPGDMYLAIGDYYVPYDTGSQDNPFNEGEWVTWGASGVGKIFSKHDRGTNEGFLILRHVRGTALSDGATLTGQTSGHTADVDEDGGADPLEVITQVQACPLGTYAGGKLFLARGILPTNVPSADASNFQCIDSEGNVVDPPIKVTVQVTGLQSGDRAIIFRVDTASTYDVTKDEMGLATGNSLGDSTVIVDSAIAADVPGKLTGGVIRCVDVSLGEETRYRYASWSGSTFTLVTKTSGTADTGGSATTLKDAAVNFLSSDIEVGDVIRNITDGEFAIVKTIVDADTITTTPLPTGSWDAGDSYETNVLDRTYNGAEDTAWAPVIDGVATGGSLSNTLVYVADRDCAAYVRQSSGGSKILPFRVTGVKIENTGLTVLATRLDDTIVS